MVVGGVGGLGDLLTDDLDLAGEVSGVHGRALHEIGDHGAAQVQPALQGADLEAGALIAGGRVDLATLGLDHLDDVAGRTIAGALEHHVFEQVRPAGAGLVLGARAAASDDRQRQGLKTVDRVADDPDPILQGMDVGQSLSLPQRP